MNFSYIHDQDYEEEVPVQPRCVGCKGFLPFKETETREYKYPEWNVIYNEHGDETYEPAGYYIDYIPVWKCKKCGIINSIEDVYPRQ